MRAMKALRIGSRKSALALWQARWVRDRLRGCFPDLPVDIVTMDTAGDRNLATPLPSIADKGFFTAEIEEALFSGGIDLAVHSLKDLPTELPCGLEIGAYCERADARDAFLGKGNVAFADLPEGAQVGTSSLRRVAQVKRLRPDVVCVDMRGNLNTRWRKLQESDALAGIILAAAGVDRLGWQDRVTGRFPCDEVIPAPGQGVIAVEIASAREEVRAIVRAVNHRPSEYAARAERAFLAALDGGCQTPLGAFATCEGDAVELEGIVLSLDGSCAVRARGAGTDPEEAGRRAAEQARARGADAILAQTCGPRGEGR